MNEYRDISTLHNWEHNPRSMTKDGLARLIKQIKKLGVYKPLLITEDGTVLGGNMRLQALRELGQKEVWVSVVDAPTEEKKIEYALSDNDRAGKYEADQLANLIGNFPDVEWGAFTVDLSDPMPISTLIDKYKDVKQDEPPSLSSDKPESKLGEIYTLGRHKLLCGSATDVEAVNRLIPGEVEMTFTDPPYNMAYEGNGKQSREGIMNDDLSDNDFKDLLNGSLAIILDKTKGGIYCCMHPKELTTLHALFSSNGGHFQSYIIWVKNTATLGGSDYQHQYEPIMYGWNKKVVNHYFVTERNLTDTWHEIDRNIKFENGKTSISVGDIRLEFEGKVKGRMRENNKYSNVWSIPKPTKSEDHPTMKPIALVARAIINSTREGEAVYDPFLGSGTTLIACEQTNRTCYGVELDPHYCDVIRKRYAKFINRERDWLAVTPAENSENAA